MFTSQLWLLSTHRYKTTKVMRFLHFEGPNLQICLKSEICEMSLFQLFPNLCFQTGISIHHLTYRTTRNWLILISSLYQNLDTNTGNQFSLPHLYNALKKHFVLGEKELCNKVIPDLNCTVQYFHLSIVVFYCCQNFLII